MLQTSGFAVSASNTWAVYSAPCAGLLGLVGRQKKELAERTALYDAAMAKLREVDLIMRGFFTNLVTAINEPFHARVALGAK